MAVVKVFGRVDGVEVVLQKAEGNRWSVPVPLDQDGEYVVEIIAEDEAGNQSYLAKMLYVVNTAMLCAHMIPIPYYASLLEHPIDAKPVTMQREIEILPPEYGLRRMNPDVWAELIEPECSLTGRR